MKTANRAAHWRIARLSSGFVAFLLIWTGSPSARGAARLPSSAAGSWSQSRFDAARSGFNRFEHTLSPANVPKLHVVWAAPTTFETSAPSVADGKIFIGNFRLGLPGLVKAFNANDGATIWTARMAPSDYPTTPAVANGMVYVGSLENFTTYAFDEATGALVWATFLDSTPWTAPAVVGSVVYVGAAGGLFALDAFTGDVIWKADTGYTTLDPAVANGMVYTGNLATSTIDAVDASTGTVKWVAPSPLYPTRGPVVADGIVYFVAENGYDGTLAALDAVTGAPIWKRTLDGYVLGDPAVSGGTLFISTGDFGYHLYALDARTGRTLWMLTTGGEGFAPAIANGVVFFSTRRSTDGNSIYAVDAKSGVRLWRFKSLHMILNVIVSDGTVYATSLAGHVLAFRLRQGG